jgi:pimeloyl-ACP methyl ester carboxylesterase/AraC-like DNA-binding protein
MDVLDDVLNSLRLNGGVILEGHARGDWCVSSQFQPEDVAQLFPSGGPIIAYHYIQSGRVFAQIDGQSAVAAPAGSIVMFPRNDRHRLFTSATETPTDSHAFVMAGAEGRIARFEIGENGEEAEFFCGFLGVENADHPLLDCLPPLLVIDDVEAAQEDWLESNLKFLTGAPQDPETVARVAEMLFAHAVKAYVAELGPGEGGWLRALKDPHVARALRVIHARYAEDLDVEMIAREAGVSRSVLGERFVELLGEPPMRYCAKWRMRVAANLLRDGRENSANIAYAVGFNSEAAFNRAFKREHGEPPIAWKRRVAGEEALRRGDPQDEPETRLARAKRTERVGTCISSDGTCIGYSEIGEGFPLLMPAVWYHQVRDDWSSPVWGHWLAEAIKAHRLIRTDLRGTGLSDRHVPGWSLDVLIDDFAAVVEDVGVQRFDILAFAHGGLVAMAYAARHPDRVRKLIVVGGYAQGFGVRGDPDEIARRDSLTLLARNYKGAPDSTFAQMLGTMYWPTARGETVDWFSKRLTTVNSLDERLQEVLRNADVKAELPAIRAETVLLHSKGDRIVSYACAQEIAEEIPQARLVSIDSENHVVIGTEPAWERARAALRTALDSADDTGLVNLPRAKALLPERHQMIASDGARIAYESIGEGFPLVKAATWITHLDLDDSSPVYRHWIAEASRQCRFVHSDMRGFGLSQWDPPELSFEAIARDFAEMIDHAGIDRCDLLGLSHGAAVAIDYAAKHPERVRKLVIVNGFAAGWKVRADPEEVAWRTSLMEMNQREWAFRRSRFGEMYLTLYFPDASPEIIKWHNDHFEELGPVPNLQHMIEIAAHIDVRDRLEQVRCETLVCHSRQDGNATLPVGREMAERIPGARLVEFDGANHLLLGDEPAWPLFTRELRAFLRTD